MSWQAVEAVFKYSHSKGSARLLLLCIARYAQSDGTNARVAVPTLEADTKIDRRQIKRLLKVLETDLGELSRRIGGGRESNTYAILLPLCGGTGATGGSTTSGLCTTGDASTSGVNATPAMALEPPVHKQTSVEPSVVLNIEQTTADRTQLLAALEAEGVTQNVALDLVDNPQTLARISLQLAWLNDRQPQDRAATLVSSIRKNWSAPAAFMQRERAREFEAAESARRAHSLALQNQSRETKARLLAATEAENAALDARYSEMGEAERAGLDAEVMLRLGPLAQRASSSGAIQALRRNLMREMGEHQNETS